MRQQIQTAGEIAADQTEPDGTLMLDDSTGTSTDVSEADPAPDTSLPSGAGTGDAGSPGRGRPALGMLALILGSVIAVVGSWWWWEAAHDDQLAVAQDRDSALIAGTEGIETINTLDYRDTDTDLAAWEEVTTGQFQDGIAGIDEGQRQLLIDEQKIATAEVVDAAVLSIDGEEATVVAAVEITVIDDAAPDSEPTLKRNRFSAQMTLVEGEWKIENLQQVAVSLS
ncbi:hypothetical protein [Aeromicrobium sp. Sec7.5]|uniref:hypothetical protein n=1 Tax=Aeromicrobium sp. Sec7.5 TaxID=3121276 RepID=UPI002FE43BB8